MKSKSPFLSKSPLKSMMPGDPSSQYLASGNNSLMGNFNPSRMNQAGGGLLSGGGSSANFDRTKGRGTQSGGGGMPTNMDLGNMTMQGDPGGGTSTVSQDYNSNMRNQYGGGGSNEMINNIINTQFREPANTGGQVIYGASGGMDPDGGGSGGGINPGMPQGGPIDTTGRGTIADNPIPVSPQGEPLGETTPDTTQERIDEQLRASNAQRIAEGGTRGQPGDAGYNSQVNAVTGQTPDAYADEVTTAQENMGTNIANSDTTGGDGGIGTVTTTNSGERTANVATTDGGQPDPGQSGYLDESGNMGENVEISSNPGGTVDTANPGTGPNDVEQTWVNDSGAVTMPEDVPIPGTTDTPTYNPLDTPKPDATPPPVVAQTTNVETATPPTQGANIPESVGGDNSVAEKIKESVCDTNYQGDGILYDGLT